MEKIDQAVKQQEGIVCLCVLKSKLNKQWCIWDGHCWVRECVCPRLVSLRAVSGFHQLGSRQLMWSECAVYCTISEFSTHVTRNTFTHMQQTNGFNNCGLETWWFVWIWFVSDMNLFCVYLNLFNQNCVNLIMRVFTVMLDQQI